MLAASVGSSGAKRARVLTHAEHLSGQPSPCAPQQWNLAGLVQTATIRRTSSSIAPTVYVPCFLRRNMSEPRPCCGASNLVRRARTPAERVSSLAEADARE